MYLYLFIFLLAQNGFTCAQQLGDKKKKEILHKTKCKNIKCPPIEDPVCVKIKNEKNNNIAYIVVINSCEIQYAKCHQGFDAVIVSMKNCEHNIDSVKMAGTKRSKREATGKLPDDAVPGPNNASDHKLNEQEKADEENEEDNDIIELNNEDKNEADVDDENKVDVGDGNKADADDDNEAHGDDGNKADVVDEKEENVDDENAGDIDDGNKADGDDENEADEDDGNKADVDDENEADEGDENKADVDDENKAGGDYDNEGDGDDENKADGDYDNEGDVDDKNDKDGDDYYAEDTEGRNDNDSKGDNEADAAGDENAKEEDQKVDEEGEVELNDNESNFEEQVLNKDEDDDIPEDGEENKSKDVSNVGDDYDQAMQDVDYVQNEKSCPNVCPAREVMVCAKCQHNIYRTFISPCHLRMFHCEFPNEKIELISRQPCMQSAPFLTNLPEAKGRVSEPGDKDRVLKFINCRDKGKLDDPKCNFDKR